MSDNELSSPGAPTNPSAEVAYQVGEMYTPNCERGIRFDDPALGLKWPMAPTVMSDKDKNWPAFEAKVVEVSR